MGGMLAKMSMGPPGPLWQRVLSELAQVMAQVPVKCQTSLNPGPMNPRSKRHWNYFQTSLKPVSGFRVQTSLARPGFKLSGGLYRPGSKLSGGLHCPGFKLSGGLHCPGFKLSGGPPLPWL